MSEEIERDRFGRPYVVGLNGRREAYTRCTTFVGCIEDTFKLGQWQQRHLALGLAAHDDLLSAVRTGDMDDRAAMNALCDEARRRSGAGDAALIGTWLHARTEAMDRGLDGELIALPDTATPVDPLDYAPDLAAYAEATRELEPVLIEAFCVQDPLKVGGTPDRVVKYRGKRYIADLKTGSIEFGALKIAAQLAMYSRSQVYDFETHVRTPHDADRERGIVIHAPAGTGTCRLYWVDLRAGWEAVRVCREVREQRRNGYRKLMMDFSGSVDLVPEEPLIDPLLSKITEATTREALTALWSENVAAWTEQHTAATKARLVQLAS